MKDAKYRFGVSVFRASSRKLYTSSPLVNFSLNVIICKNKLEVRTSDNRGAPLRGRFCKHPISSKRRIKEIDPALVIGPNHFFHFLLYMKPS